MQEETAEALRGELSRRGKEIRALEDKSKEEIGSLVREVGQLRTEKEALKSRIENGDDGGSAGAAALKHLEEVHRGELSALKAEVSRLVVAHQDEMERNMHEGLERKRISNRCQVRTHAVLMNPHSRNQGYGSYGSPFPQSPDSHPIAMTDPTIRYFLNLALTARRSWRKRRRRTRESSRRLSCRYRDTGLKRNGSTTRNLSSIASKPLEPYLNARSESTSRPSQSLWRPTGQRSKRPNRGTKRHCRQQRTLR